MNSFRDFEKSLCILRDRTCINILDPDQNSGANGILCYGYVDHAAGLTFEGLALVSCVDDDYLRDNDELISLDAWVRDLDPKESFYIGGIIDYHW